VKHDEGTFSCQSISNSYIQIFNTEIFLFIFIDENSWCKTGEVKGEKNSVCELFRIVNKREDLNCISQLSRSRLTWENCTLEF
jgi:hypothetical protein